MIFSLLILSDNQVRNS